MTARFLPLLILLGACAPAASSAPVQPAPSPIRTVRSSPEAIAKARADSARLPWTEADARFMTGMIGHHAQAIDMSRLAPGRAGSQSIRTLAARIINAQQDEIVTMQQWLSDRQLPVPEARAQGMKHMMDGEVHEMLMPGMLTPDQVAGLTAAQGAEFDRLFLTYMIQHHNGAVTMVSELFSSQGAGEDETVFKFASDVNVDQSTEIARMEKMLAAMQGETPAQ
jgi:uncharacterized protein (DUF305 family)